MLSEYKLYDHLPVGVFVIDPTRKVLFWNRTMVIWTGIKAEEIMGTAIEKTLSVLARPKYATRIEQVFQSGPPTVFSAQLHQSILAELPRCRERFHITTVSPLRMDDESSTAARALFNLQDVTDLIRRNTQYSETRKELKAQMAQRLQLEGELMEARKMEAVSGLAGSFAHYVNNRLQVITSNVELAQLKGSKEKEGVEKYLDKILSEIHRTKLIANTFQDIGKIKGDVTSINIATMMRELVEKFKKTPWAERKIYLPEANNQIIVWGNPMGISRAIEEILKNAVHATRNGGEISIEFSTGLGRQLSSHDPGHTIDPEKFCHILIRDTGEGMEDSLKHKAFEPFFQTGPEGERSGMGLTLAHAIVQAHNGGIDFHSVKQQGTAVTVTLPMRHRVPETKRPSSPAGLPSSPTA